MFLVTVNDFRLKNLPSILNIGRFLVTVTKKPKKKRKKEKKQKKRNRKIENDAENHRKLRRKRSKAAPKRSTRRRNEAFEFDSNCQAP